MSFAIAAGHPETVQAARHILEAGGNAMDAAIAAFVMSWVAEPLMASAGGGGFATVAPVSGKPVVFDFFTHTPCQRRKPEEIDYFSITVDFGGTLEDFYVGMGSSAVPGSIAGVFKMHELFGKTPLKEIFSPAIEAANRGVEVNHFQQYNYQLLESILRLYPEGRSLFFRNDRLVSTGEKLYFPQMADFLDYLWQEGPNAFYKGEVARKIAYDYQAEGGHLREEDFARYEVRLSDPLKRSFHDRQVLVPALPSVGGSLIQYGLENLKDTPPDQHPLGEDHLMQILPIIRQMEPLSQNPGKLALLLGAGDVETGQGPSFTDSSLGNTTQISIADKAGNAVSLTCSNGQGNGYFVEHTNIQMNNMLGEPALLPGGHHSWKPDTRLASMMAPTVVLGKDGKPEIVTGSAGAGRIPYAIMQVLHFLLSYKLHVQQAVAYPRIHWHDGVTHLEPGFDYGAEIGLRMEQVEQWEKQSLFFGGAHSLLRIGQRWEAYGDSRRDGQSFVARV